MNKFMKLKLAAVALLAIGSVGAMASANSQEVYLGFNEKVLAGYALLAQGKTSAEQAEIMARVQRYIARGFEKTEVIEVRNFAEFLESFRGEWPNSGQLEADLRRIESLPPHGRRTYTSKSPSVLRKIAEYQKNNQHFLATAGFGLLQEQSANKSVQLDGVIANQLENFNKIGERVASAGMSAVKDPVKRIFMQTLFKEYYARLSLDAKKQIIMSMANSNLLMTDEAKLELMIQNSGPQFQKLLQVVARQGGLPPELQRTFKKLESAVRAEPWWKVEAILKAEKGNFDFTYFERKPLGVGTMAQVHRAKVIWNGKVRDVVVRFIKPGIEALVDEDHRILVEVAKIVDQNPEYRRHNGPLMTPLIRDITNTVRAELDQDATIERQLSAKKSYTVESFLNTPEYKNVIQFQVPEVLRSKPPSKLMIQEMSIGRSLDKEADFYKETIPGLKKGVVEATAKLWAEVVMFRSGFYHSDLHQGNYLVQVKDEAIVVTILDYGMGGVLTEQMRQQVMLAGVATLATNEKLISEAFWAMSEKSGNSISPEIFRQKVATKINDLNLAGETLQFEQWTGWASDQGLKIPYDLINLSRGMIIMNNSLKEVGSSKSISKIEEELAVRNVKQAYNGLKGTGLVSNKELAQAGMFIIKQKLANPGSPQGGGTVGCEAIF